MTSQAHDAFDVWYLDNHRRVVLAVSLSTLTAGDRATDAADEAFVRAFEKWQKVQAMEYPVGWVVRVAINLVRRQLWRETRVRNKTRLGADQFSAASYPDVDLWDAVSRLPRRQREAVVLRYVEGRTQTDIARIQGVAAGTAGATLTQARATLRKDPNLRPEDIQ